MQGIKGGERDKNHRYSEYHIDFCHVACGDCGKCNYKKNTAWFFKAVFLLFDGDCTGNHSFCNSLQTSLGDSFLPYSALGGACGYIIGMERGKDKWKIRRASFPNRRVEEVRGMRKKHTRLEELRKKDTLQSIDNTLKRIEVILRDGQNSPAKILQDAIEASLSQPQEHSLVLPLTIPDLSQLLEQKDLQIK